MCDFLNIHARLNTHFLLPNAFAIKQDVERAFGTTTNSLFQISIETMREVKPQLLQRNLNLKLLKTGNLCLQQ